MDTLFSSRMDENHSAFGTNGLQRLAPRIVRILEEEGVPTDLIFVAMIESGLSHQAVSRTKAVGPWQFMKGTGHLYGLKATYWLDERRDLDRSTRAAAKLFRDLYAKYDDWPLALAAYNAGPGRVNSAISKTKSKDFWKIATTRNLKLKQRTMFPKHLQQRSLCETRPRWDFASIRKHQILFLMYQSRSHSLSTWLTWHRA